MTIWKGNWIIGGLTEGARPSYIEIPNCIVHSLAHSITAALDRLRVVAISTTSGTGLRIDRHWWVGPYLLPPVKAKFSVDGPACASSQWQEVYRWRHQRMQCIIT